MQKTTPQTGPRPQKLQDCRTRPRQDPDELVTALHWLAKLVLGAVPRAATIPYSLGTRMFALGWIAMHSVVKRHPTGGVDRTPSWRITPEGEALLTQPSVTRRVAKQCGTCWRGHECIDRGKGPVRN